MRIIEMEINNIRGITYLSIKPNGKNFVVWGPNGSGKSAVVDAIDFLLTGRISRLTGTGTRGITLNRHGPHIDHKPKEASIKAIIKFPNLDNPVEIRRTIADPTSCECDPLIKPIIEPILNLAKRGQHVLTRRDILKFVTSEAKVRANQIQDLLDLSEIENIRSNLVTVKNQLENGLGYLDSNVENAKLAINNTCNIDEYNSEVVLKSINDNRRLLGGKDITEINIEKIKSGIIPPTKIEKKYDINPEILNQEYIKYNINLSNIKENIIKNIDTINTTVKKINEQESFMKTLNFYTLTKLGLNLLDNTGKCPLCDTDWPEGKLKLYLKEKMAKADFIINEKKIIDDVMTNTIMEINKISQNIIQFKLSADKIEFKNRLFLEKWLNEINSFINMMTKSVENYELISYNKENIDKIFAPQKSEKIITELINEGKRLSPEITPELLAWDTLTRLEENLKSLEKAENEYNDAVIPAKRAKKIHDVFLIARDEVLSGLYNDIRDKFVALYRSIHKLDESQFSATIQPDKAGLDFEVDFYGRGNHPPHALHSEGHQDSMGLCLYLALSEKLNQGLIDLTILDDVMMSVDADHRRQICNILATNFPNRQFLITTHDKTWANQLRTEGVVSQDESIEFYDWNVSTGPKTHQGFDIWDGLKKYLKGNNVPEAAAELRRGSEEYFASVCDALKVPVEYNLNHSWELGDYLIPAQETYSHYLKKSINAAKSWGDKEKEDSLIELDSQRAQIFTRINSEQWAVNSNVHYNNWANFTYNDFIPVVEAFEDLWSLFRCNKCWDLINVTKIGNKPKAVQCRCGTINWNLTPKISDK